MAHIISHISVVVKSVSRKRGAVTQSNWLVFLSLGLHNCSHQQRTMHMLVAKRCHHRVVLHKLSSLLKAKGAVMKISHQLALTGGSSKK